MIDVKYVGAERIALKFGRLELEVARTDELLDAVSLVQIDNIKKGVERGIKVPTGRFKKLADVTVERRRKKAREGAFGHNQPLLDTGAMIGSLGVLEKTSVSRTIGPSPGIESTKGKAHQFGTSRIPERKWVGLRKGDEKKIHKEMTTWVKTRRKRAGL